MNEPRPAAENKMGTMPVPKLLFTMSIPMVISMLVQALYYVVDSVFVAKLSEDALNAVSLAFPVQNLMISVAVGTGVGINALLSKSLGEKRQERANAAAMNGLFLAVVSCLVFVLLGLTCSRGFFLLQTDQQTIVDYGAAYMSIVSVLSGGMFLQITFDRVLQATGRTVYTLFTQAVGAVINIILDPILIFGLFGLPRLEVAGAALATVIGQFIAAGLSLFFNLTRNHDIQFRFRGFRPDRGIIARIYSVGVPSIVMSSIGSVMVFGMNKILFSFTKTATAVFGAYFKLQSFVFMPVFGLNNGMVPIVSYNYGAASLPRVKRTIKLTICTAMAIMAVGCLICQLFPQQLLMFFNASEEMLSIGSVALRIISVSFVLAGFDIIAGSVCQAIGNPLYSLITSVCRQLVVLLPVAWLLSHTGVLTLVWLAFPISELVSLVLSAIFLRRTMRAVAERIGSRAA